jgi:hypothetical protein
MAPKANAAMAATPTPSIEVAHTQATAASANGSRRSGIQALQFVRFVLMAAIRRKRGQLRRRRCAERMGTMKTALGGALAAAAVFAAAPAHADDASYRQYLLDHGYGGGVGPAIPGGPMISAPGLFVDWGKTLADGHMLCDRLHSGATYSDLERQYGSSPYFHPVVDAAQAELCPDTLGR